MFIITLILLWFFFCGWAEMLNEYKGEPIVDLTWLHKALDKDSYLY
jgi:hypothetical protein